MRLRDVLAYRRQLRAACDRRPHPDEKLPDGSSWLYAVDAIREALTSAPAYYVTDDMTAVARAAARTMPNQPLLLSDLPSEQGFMIFGAALAYWTDGADERIPITGIVWDTEHYSGRLLWEDGDHEPIMTAEEWAAHPERFDNDGSIIDDIPTAAVTGVEIDMHPLIVYDQMIMPVGSMHWTVGDEPEPVQIDGEWYGGAADDEYGLARPLLATWTLMQQSLTIGAPAKVSPTDRKRNGRLAMPSDLVVVRLRRLSTAVEDTDTPHGDGPDYTHQWLVGGHWRNQWLPSRAAHRLQWISPYVKGPADKPLVVKERLTVWER